MNKFLISLSTIFALFAFNASAADGKIGILDVEKIVKQSKAMRNIQKQVSKKQDQYQKQVTKKQEALEKEQKKIESKKSVLSQEALEKEVKQFEKKVKDLKEFVDKRQNKLKKASLDGMNKVNEKIKDIIADIAEERGLSIIIPSAQVLYYQDGLDISDEVLDRLNKKITKVKVKF